MNRVKKQPLGMLTAALLAAGLSMGIARAAYAPATNLYINGGLASDRVILHNGLAYVPVSDVAKALNQVVVAKSDGYSITPAGGANQVSGLNGKVGDKLTDGQFSFTVVKAFRTDRYKRQFDTGSDATPDAPTDDVVVAVIRCKNMLNTPVDFFAKGGSNTAMTDQDEHSYQVSLCDSRSSAPTLLPGSAYDLALCFSVPKSEKVGDLVYQWYFYDRTRKPTTFRVSLASVNTN